MQGAHISYVIQAEFSIYEKMAKSVDAPQLFKFTEGICWYKNATHSRVQFMYVPSTDFWLQGLKGIPRHRWKDNIRMDALGI
jgi:hypothetical protein